MQVERQPVGDVDHGVRTRPPGQFALPQAGQRAPVGGHGGAVPAAGTELPQARRRTPARARDQHDVPRPRPGARDGRRTTVLDRAQHRHGHRQLGRARHVAADHRAPGRRRGLGHAGHDPRRQLPLAGAARHAQRHQCRQRRRAHGGQVAQRAHQRLPAHVTRAAERQVHVDPLDHAVDRRQQRPRGRKVQHGGVVAQPEGLDSVSHHASDTL